MFTTSSTRETTNHYYSTSDILGRGATCEVYKGISKSGEYRALKIFLARGRKSDIEREVVALKNLQHKNVIIFYNLEKDIKTSRPVVVTELCEHGSLQDVLNEIPNKYGLDEEEFLLIFRHLVDGIRHLRNNGFVHRDIKPGNILRCVDETGRSLYKLSDFGTARLLEDDGQFMSLVGTEEYLHPKLYNAAFFNGNLVFDAKVDLWSLGATLYHCATGSVPFRPYGGREDKDAMRQMLFDRPSGAIAGVQHHQNGKILWVKDLPHSTSLSGGLKRLITTLITGLFEIDEEKTWTFDVFFNVAETILNKIAVTVLSTIQNPTWIYKIYMDPNESLTDLQQHLKDQTGIKVENQQLFYQNEFYQTSVLSEKDSLTNSNFPKTDLDRPIILLHRQKLDVHHGICAYLEEVEADKELKFSVTMDLNYDIQIANMIGGHMNIISKQCQVASKLQQNTIELQHKLLKNLRRNIDLAKEIRRHSWELHHEIHHFVSKVAEQYDMWPLNVDRTIFDTENLIKAIEEDIMSVVETFRTESIDISDDWCFLDSICSQKCTCLLSQASVIINRISKRRKNLFIQPKTAYDGLQHSADKKTLLQLKESVITLWKDHCLIKTRQLQDKINSWACFHIEASEKIENCLKLLENVRVSNISVLKVLREESPDSLKEEIEILKGDRSVFDTHFKRSADLKDLTKILPDIYQPEDMSLDVRGTVLSTEEDETMGTLIL